MRRLRHTHLARYAAFCVLVGVLLLTIAPLHAQDESPTPAPPAISDDAVNEVAEHMYCPVCEMEPVDTCMASTCIQWRAIIRDMLGQGFTEDEIHDYFVDQYGDRVMGVPQSAGLWSLAFLGPVIFALLALGLGVMTMRRWLRNREPNAPAAAPVDPATAKTDPYRTRLENDLQD
jgi:cytochrome c-type biogenesis protein CcmH